MKSFLATLNAGFDHVINFVAYLAGGLVVFVMLTTFAEVTVRKLAGISNPLAVEIGQHSILYITFFSAAWLLREEGHVSMDLLASRLKPGPRALLDGIMSIIGAIACFLVSWFGALATWDYFIGGVYYPVTVQIPMALLVAPIPPGGLLLFIQFLRRAYRRLVAWKRGVIEPLEEAKETPTLA